MTQIRLRIYPDTVLRKETKPVTVFNDGLKDLVADMARVMHTYDGVGLAAPQIGISLKIAVVFHGGILYVLANPRVVHQEGEQVGEEGCLSFPGIYGPVRRPMKITVEHDDVNGKRHRLDAEGLLARAILHEMDHMEGRLLIDSFPPLKRSMVRKQLMRGGTSPEKEKKWRI